MAQRISKQASQFISRKISRNVSEGRPLKQSIAIAFSQARKAGFKVPKNPMRK